MVELSRDKINLAPYNPRYIDPLARKKLRENIEANGLVQPLIWNKRTGNLVGGHQRLDIIDGLKKTRDYTLQVAAIDVDDIRERELNIFLNNTAAQGDWDATRLAEVLKIDGLSMNNTGFDRIDLELVLDDQMRAGARKNAAKVDDAEFFTVLVFNSRDEVEEFHKALDLPDERYVNGRLVMERFRELNQLNHAQRA